MTVVESAQSSVVWWKTTLALAEIPRRHVIGWCDVSGRPSGTVTITNPHPRLDRRTIETALIEDLTARLGHPLLLGPVNELADQLSVEARIRTSGHQVLDRDLAAVYGHHVVGGVVASLLGRGIQAYVLVDHDTSAGTRCAVLSEAEEALEEFTSATPSELLENGWERGHEDRWQLFLERF